MFSTLDNYTLHVAAGIAGRWPLLDKVLVKFFDLPSVKILPLVAVIVWLWATDTKDGRSRCAVVEATVGLFVAVLVARLTANLMPMRLRPFRSGHPDFVAPIGLDRAMLEHWSSFPSDHAALTFALSTAVWRYSRSLGLACYLWAASVACLPRIYAGYHYGTDILGGAIIGIVVVFLLRRTLPSASLVSFIERLSLRHPGLSTAALFILLFQISTMFGDVRKASVGFLKGAPVIGTSVVPLDVMPPLVR